MLFIDCEEWCKAYRKNMNDVEKAGLEVGVLWQDLILRQRNERAEFGDGFDFAFYDCTNC